MILLFHMYSELYGPLQQHPGLKEPGRDDVVRFPPLFSVDLCQCDKLNICIISCGMGVLC